MLQRWHLTGTKTQDKINQQWRRDCNAMGRKRQQEKGGTGTGIDGD